MTENQSTTQLHAFVTSARARWRMVATVRGLAWGAAAGAGSIVVLLALDLPGLIPDSGRPLMRWLPAGVFLGVFATFVVRLVTHAPSARALALRAEEVAPELEHVPSTALDIPKRHPYRRMMHEEASRRLRSVAPAALFAPILTARRALLVTGLVVAAYGAVVVSGGPSAVWAAWDEADPAHRSGARAGGPTDDPERSTVVLGPLSVRIVPPAYTGLPTTEGPVPDVLSALPGSHVEIMGDGATGHVAVTVVRDGGDRAPLQRRAGGVGRSDGTGRATDESGTGWSAGWTLMPADRGLLVRAALEGDTVERIIPVAPSVDPPPAVELLEPARDFVLASGSGEIAFRARALDAFGIDDFRLTWVHTRGSGESFDFREGSASWTEEERTERGAEGRLVLRLDDLDLGPGEVLHLRAVATDANVVTGPGTGASETRQIRIVREGEEMAVDALAGFPLELDQEPVLSQRMILLMTEDLLARAPDLPAAEVRREAEAIADEQARLRRQVGDQIYSRSTGAMEEVDMHLGHDLAGADHEHHAEPTPPPPPSGSRYGVASIFDPASEPEPVAISDRLPTGAEHGDPASTQVGAYQMGGAGRLPPGFGVLDELGHDHDSDPVLSVNRPLLAIYDAMWAAERELRVIDPRASIPHQETAVDALQALRENQRVFPRGRVTVPPVDVGTARGTGAIDDAEPAPRSGHASERSRATRLAELEHLLLDLRSEPEDGAALAERANALARSWLGDPNVPAEAVAAAVRSTQALRAGDLSLARRALADARDLLEPARPRTRLLRSAGRGFAPGSPWALDPGARVSRDGVSAPSDLDARSPFVFATLRYESGNWDSAPLVPQNLIHALAQYTDLPVAPEGVVVDLSSPEIFRYPFLYLTGHLPVRFSSTEARNLESYVRRGGFVFMDDHNHDVDGAFHRTATAELERIFGTGALEALPSDHELYRSYFAFEDGPPVTAHELSGWGDGLIHPELFAITVEGRIGVLYSNKDYSSEWSYHAVNKRFLAVDNTRFGVNILVYALTR